MQQPTIDMRVVKASSRGGGGQQQNESIVTHTMAGDDGIGQQTREQMEDDEVDRDATTNNQRKRGKDKQRLAMRLRRQWMAMGSKRGWRPSTKASTLVMMKTGGGLQGLLLGVSNIPF